MEKGELVLVVVETVRRGQISVEEDEVGEGEARKQVPSLPGQGDMAVCHHVGGLERIKVKKEEEKARVLYVVVDNHVD